MVFGGVQQEHLQFNDKTLWTGNETTRGAYQNFGDLYLDVPGLTAVSDYRRELDIEEGIARVRYRVGSTEYTRDYFASYPDDVIVMRFSASAANAVNFTISMTDAHTGTKTSTADTITLTGALDLLSYQAQIKVLNEGGSLSTSSNKITVTGANAVTVLLAAGTDYDPIASDYTGSGLSSRISSQIAAAAGKTYTQLKTAHIADYQALFNRVSLALDDSKPTLPTDALLSSYNAGNYDPALDVLYFQYGRYLMIGSSRGMALPSNLQGLWNNSNSPPWESDIHSNINIQMNYWPAEVTNLSECHTPFLDYIYNEAMVQSSWQAMASSLGNPGWTLKTQSNIFAYSDWNWNRPANAWYCMHLWQHYAYTLDAAYLSAKAYPAMKSACEFWIDRLVTDSDGKLVAPGEWSPEHGPWENGVSYAQQLIWDLFTNTLKAAEILNVDAAFRTTLQTTLSNLDTGVRVGNWGQLREWKYTNDSQTNDHRHISHLVGLYPGNQISPFIDPQFSEAAKVSLNARGDGGTGWARAWKICTWARLLDGNHAHTLVKNALRLTYTTTLDMTDSGGVYENLLDAHPPFQIDGNFGGTAGITEMLLQSNLGPIQLLPALPDAWPSGQVSGLRATNGFEVDLSWAGSQLIDATIKSDKGHQCELRGIYDVTLLDETPVSATLDMINGTTTFDTQVGVSYVVAQILPSAPVGLIAIGGDASVSLDWADNTADLASYSVYRSTTSGSGYASIASGLTASDYTDNTVTNGTTYYYVVTATDTSSNESPYSNEDPATPQAATADSITVLNPSFEEPGTVKQTNWESVPGWSSDTVASDSGTEAGGMDGAWEGFLKGSDPAVWQLTDHVLAANEIIELSVYSMYGWLGSDLTMTFYYDNAGSRVTVASRQITLLSTWQEYTLSFNVNDVPAAAGKRIGILLDNPSSAANWILVDKVVLLKTSVSNDQTPYGGSARALPGRIEAEHYDEGGEGIAYHDTTTGNSGGAVRTDNVDIEARDSGYNVGWTIDGEWLEFTVDATAGACDLQARVAATSSGKQVVVKLDDVTLGTIDVPNTGDWGTFQTVTVPNVSITGGSGKILRVEFVGGSTNLNWIELVSIAPDTDPPAAPSGLVATAGDGFVNLDWADNGEDDLAGYSVFRSTTSGSGYVSIISGQATSDYVDDTVTNGTTYYYVVTATDTSSNESGYSNEDSATPLPVGDLTGDAKVNLEDLAELGTQWQNVYTMNMLLDIADNWLYGTTQP